MPLWPVPGLVAPVMIGPAGATGLGSSVASLFANAPGTGGLGTANGAFYYPFWVPAPFLAQKMWVQGSTGAGTGNFDLGIYSSDLKALIVSSGATAKLTTTVLQEADITDTVLGRGLYYAAFAVSNGTDTYYTWFVSGTGVQFQKMMGVCQSTTNYPLAANPTVVIRNGASMFMFGVAGRTLVA